MHDHDQNKSPAAIVFCRYCGKTSNLGVQRCPECRKSLKDERAIYQIQSKNCGPLPKKATGAAAATKYVKTAKPDKFMLLFGARQCQACYHIIPPGDKKNVCKQCGGLVPSLPVQRKVLFFIIKVLILLIFVYLVYRFD